VSHKFVGSAAKRHLFIQTILTFTEDVGNVQEVSFVT
jgi:hypothetical protein